MSTRRTEDGAVKCALRHFRRELVTRGLRFMAAAAAAAGDAPASLPYLGCRCGGG